MRNDLGRSLVLGLVLFAGCAVEEEPDIGTSEEALTNASTALDWMWKQAVKPNPCTATLIAPRFAILALHCTGQGAATEGTPVHFYTSGPIPNPNITRTIVAVHHPVGTHRPPNNSRYDDFGVFGDIAILELDADAPATSTVTTLYWKYIGEGYSVTQVGAGNHDGVPNEDDDLRYVNHRTASADDSDGKISVTVARGNPQDSGGPLYQGRFLIGIYFGGTSFTSVPHRLDWILGAIGWTWPHGASSWAYRVGDVTDSFAAESERVCQYACDHGRCDAYNYAGGSGTCELVTDVTFSIFTASWRSDFDAP